MIATPAAPPTPPAIVQPAPYQASFGQVVATVPPGTRYALLYGGGKLLATVSARRHRVRIPATLPMRDLSLRVVAVGDGWRRASPAVGPVFGLPANASPRAAQTVLDLRLQSRVRTLVTAFPGSAGAYVQDLRSGLGAAWNARARFPAASSLKLAIAVETLRTLAGQPPNGSAADRLLRSMLVYSDNAAANALEVLIAGSTSAGSARVNSTMRAIGLTDSDMYGGYELDRPLARPIPLTIVEQPAIGSTKHSTPADLARLARAVYLASGGVGPLVRRVSGFTPTDARYLLYLLLHVRDPGKLDRFLPSSAHVAHKAGWNSAARVDNGLVFSRRGAFVATVMTFGAGVGTRSDVLAGLVARAGLDRFRSVERDLHIPLDG